MSLGGGNAMVGGFGQAKPADDDVRSQFETDQVREQIFHTCLCLSVTINTREMHGNMPFLPCPPSFSGEASGSREIGKKC